MAKASQVLFLKPDLDFLVENLRQPRWGLCHFAWMHKETTLCIQPCPLPRHLLLNPTTSLQLSASKSPGHTRRALQNCTENSMGKRPVQSCNSHFPQRGSGFTCKILAVQILHPALTILPASLFSCYFTACRCRGWKEDDIQY